MARSKAKAKGLLSPQESLKPYTPTLNGKFVKTRDSQSYWGFPEPRYDPKSKTMVPGFELFLDYDNKLPELREKIQIRSRLIGKITWILMQRLYCSEMLSST